VTRFSLRSAASLHFLQNWGGKKKPQEKMKQLCDGFGEACSKAKGTHEKVHV